MKPFFAGVSAGESEHLNVYKCVNSSIAREQFRRILQLCQHTKACLFAAQALWRGMKGEPSELLGGLRQYAEPLFRPPLLGDEREPSFSNCTVPIVLYKAHDTNFCHVTISTLPQMYSFYKEGAVNQDVTYVVRVVNLFIRSSHVCEHLMSGFVCACTWKAQVA